VSTSFFDKDDCPAGIHIDIVFRDQFELITAVLSGDNTLQLRVFSPAAVSVTDEVSLTARLCKLMDRYQHLWSG